MFVVSVAKLSLFFKCGDRTRFLIINQTVLQLETYCFRKKKKNDEAERKASVHAVLTAKGQEGD